MAIKATGQITIIDLNDITVSNTAPSSPVVDQLWLDTSSSPSVLKKYTGSSWSVVNDYDPEIAALTKSSADAVEGGLLNINPLLSSWTGSYPTGMVQWSGTFYGTKETTLTRVGGAALRFAPAAANDAGVTLYNNQWFKSTNPNYKYLTVELDFYLVSGDTSAAGVLLDWSGMATYRTQYTLSQMTQEAVVVGKWYSVQKVFRRPSDTVTGFTSLMGYLMANYSGLGTKTAKDIVYDRFAIRPSSVEEIKAYESDLTIANMTNDNKLTPNEKQTLRRELDIIIAEKTTIDAQATVYGITTEKTNYGTAYTTLYNYVNPLLSSLSTTSDVTGATMRSYFSDYTTKKELLNKAITDKAKTLADNAQTSADNIDIGGTNLLLKTGLRNGEYSLSGNVGTGVTTSITLVDEANAPYGKALTITRTDAVTTSGGRYWLCNKLTVGKTYTWSVWMKGVGSWAVGQEQGGGGTYALTTTWTKYSKTFVATDSAYWQFDFYAQTSATGNYVSFYSLKLEEGNRETSWSPAPTDIQTQIDTTNTALDVAKGNINTIISATSLAALVSGGKTFYEQYTTTKQTVDAFELALANASSSISDLVADVQTNNAKISATATQIQSIVTSAYIKGSFKVGGRNLFKTSTAVSNGAHDLTINGLFMTAAQNGNMRLGGIITTSENYTVSFFAKTDTGTCSVTVDICDTGNKAFTLTTTYQKFSMTALPTQYYNQAGYQFIDFYKGVTTNAIYIKDLMVETGDVVTDWVPAVEDTQAQIDDTNNLINSVSTNFSSLVSQTSTALSAQITKQVTDLNADITQRYESEIAASATNLNLSFTNLQTSLNNTNASIANMKMYFDFSGTGLGIGKSNSKYSVNISDTSMEFRESGKAVATIDSQKMHIPNLDVDTSFEVGVHKFTKYNNFTIVTFIG